MSALTSTAPSSSVVAKKRNVKKSQLPDTVVGADGSAKRNIIRKGSKATGRKEHASGRLLDDGSLYNDEIAFDENDPNFDSEDDDGSLAVTNNSLYREDIGKSRITLTTYKRKIETFITEFFVSGDFDDITRTIFEIDAAEYSYEFVKRLLNMSLDKGDRERELVSQLMSLLYPDVLSTSMICKGFERLFEIVDEVEKDVPHARNHVATFLARAVLDEVVPPSFLSDSVVCNLGGEIVVQAKLLLSREHGGTKLERIWGPGDGRPVSEMKVAIDQCCEEYLLSGDIEEATRCIKELNALYFSHEVVKRAVKIALDKDEKSRGLISKFLTHMHSEEVVSTKQILLGFDKLDKILPDLMLDTPNADKLVAEFKERATTDGIIPSC